MSGTVQVTIPVELARKLAGMPIESILNEISGHLDEIIDDLDEEAEENSDSAEAVEELQEVLEDMKPAFLEVQKNVRDALYGLKG